MTWKLTSHGSNAPIMTHCTDQRQDGEESLVAAPFFSLLMGPSRSVAGAATISHSVSWPPCRLLMQGLHGNSPFARWTILFATICKSWSKQRPSVRYEDVLHPSRVQFAIHDYCTENRRSKRRGVLRWICQIRISDGRQSKHDYPRETTDQRADALTAAAAGAADMSGVMTRAKGSTIVDLCRGHLHAITAGVRWDEILSSLYLMLQYVCGLRLQSRHSWVVRMQAVHADAIIRP
jgi:hypothetical protein